MLGRTWEYVLCTICSFFVVGCGDPVKTTSQSVRLRVVDLTSGKPVAGASVSLKLDYLTPHPQSDEVRGYDPWFHSVTAGDGQADIAVEYTALDRSWGANPPAGRDWVTGKPYLVRVEKDQTPEEESSVVMKVGGSVKGKAFTVIVIRIKKPRYTETK
jgi:hypothetical protein